VKFAFIQQHSSQFPVDLMCSVLEVSRSGYYAWRQRPTSAQATRREELIERIQAVHDDSRQRYGSPRVHAELQAQGMSCSPNTVAKLMRLRGIRSKMRRRFVVRTTDSGHGHPIATNRLNRQFQQSAANQAWAADITYIPTAEGWLYLAAVIDLYSRKIIGWATADHLRAELPATALRMALLERKPPQELLHHSDRGVQYACDDYQQLLAKHGLTASMSRKGNCYDNAFIESFWSSLKYELVYHHRFATQAEARTAIFDYIETFYNRTRLHSSLAYSSPVTFESKLKLNHPSITVR
jgi:putative transposase